MKDFDVLKKQNQSASQPSKNHEDDNNTTSISPPIMHEIRTSEEEASTNVNSSAFQLKAASDNDAKEKSKYDQPLGHNQLPENLRTNMEAMSGVHLDDVNVHYNSNKPSQLKAEAFAQNTDIHVAPGKEQHLAHEAWHVVQQKQGRVKSTGELNGAQINDDTNLENEADQMGAKAEAGNASVIQQKIDSNPITGAPVQMWNPFKKKKKNAKSGVLSGGLTKLNTGTASDVYKATTTENIGNSGSKIGFAKKALKKGDKGNATTTNVGFSDAVSMTEQTNLTEDPNLIARSVISSRLDKQLGMNVLSDEIFSKDTDGSTIGISGMAKGKQAMENLPDGRQKHNWIDWSNPQTQKDLANLQLLDYLTGQGDRHLGNMFVDPKTGKVTGIDNDDSFGVHSVKVMGGNVLSDQDNYDNKTKKRSYLQEQIDEEGGKAILKMSEKDYLKILHGEDSDLQHIDEQSIQNSLKRFHAVKERIKELKDEGKLVKKWDQSTYDKSIGLDKGYTAPGDGKKKFHRNYVSRGYESWVDSAKEDRQDEKMQGAKPFMGVSPSKSHSNRKSRGKWKRRNRKRHKRNKKHKAPQTADQLKETLGYAGLW